jgi:hypothetical protein
MRVASSCKYGGLFDNDYLSVVGLGKWDRIISNSAMQAPFLFLKIILKSRINELEGLIMLDLLQFTAVNRGKSQCIEVYHQMECHWRIWYHGLYLFMIYCSIHDKSE